MRKNTKQCNEKQGDAMQQRESKAKQSNGHQAKTQTYKAKQC